MKRITLAMMLAAALPAVSAVSVARSQDPTPPARPVQPPQAPQPVQPMVRPAPAPRALAPIDPIDAAQAREFARDAARLDREFRDFAPRAENLRIQQDAIEASRAAIADSRISMEASREAQRTAIEDSRLAVERAREFAPMAALAPMAAVPPMAFNYAGRDFSFRMPPAPWAQGDPADSLYRAARNALTVGDWGRSAHLFAEISQKYPRSSYFNDSQYFEALARYKVGTTDELKAAAKVLEPLVGKGTDVSRRSSDMDVSTLYARINGALAMRGDAKAAQLVAAAAQAGTPTCDSDDIAVRGEALNALSQMDPTKTYPLLKNVVERKDDCSTSLRRNAVFMLARRGDAESANLLISVARSDPNASVRTAAIDALPRIPGDAGLNALEDMLKNEKDERIQRAVVHSLMQSDNQRARASMRALIDRKDAPLNLRIEAIQSFNGDRSTADDGAYLRGLYSKAESDDLKRAIIDAVSRTPGTDNQQWVLALARNANESSQLRAQAISRLIRSNVSIADLAKLYDASDSHNMRQQIINVLRSRKEPEATDKLIDIAKNSTELDARRSAINALTARNDPRSAQLLMDLIDGKKP